MATERFFEKLCEDYYEKILRYLYAALGDETAARDCTQEVFLLACQKSEILKRHPNTGGFLFQTAKNLAKKYRRESFTRLLREVSVDFAATPTADPQEEIATALDRNIDETAYIETVLSRLNGEKRQLYALYYQNGKSMAEIAALLGLEQAALRMRYVRLRREVRGIVAELARHNFAE